MTSVGELLAEIQGRADAAAKVQTWVGGNMCDLGESAGDVPRLVAALQAVLAICDRDASIMYPTPDATQGDKVVFVEDVLAAIAAALEPAPDRFYCSECDADITGLTTIVDAHRIFCNVDCHQNYAERQMQP